jgi:hypothetical protein
MLVCKYCKKEHQHEYKFCTHCGAQLERISVYTDDRTQNNLNSVQTADTPEVQPAELSGNETREKPKKGFAKVIGMFLVDLIPLLGIPISVVWAWAKFKSSKVKAIALTSVFIILNIAVTVFVYTASVNLMNNSLAKAAEKQSALKNIYQSDGRDAAGLPGYTDGSTGIDNIPGADTSSTNNTNPAGEEGFNSDSPDSLIPGFSSFSSADMPPKSIDQLPGDVNIPESDETTEYQLPGDIYMPEYDDEGNMHVDIDGDGKPDITVNADGSFSSEYIQVPGNGGTNNFLPEPDEDGYTYMDTDNDGEIDTIFCPDGMALQADRSKIDEDGRRYVDRNKDGNYEVLYDTDGSQYVDYDENGIYETLIKDGNIYYDLDEDGVFDQTESEFGQG